MLRMDHALAALELSSRSLPGSEELPEHTCTSEGKGNMATWNVSKPMLFFFTELFPFDVTPKLVCGGFLACGFLEDVDVKGCAKDFFLTLTSRALHHFVYFRVISTSAG